MNFLRRRGRAAVDETSDSADTTPNPDETNELRVIHAKSLKPPKNGKNSKRRNFWIFGLGGVFGLLLAGFFAGSNDMIDLSGFEGMNLESIFDVLPAGLVKDAQQMQKHERDAVNYDSFAVGLHARSQGVHALHPVIMIPGVISTGLESWGTEESSRQYFRKRLWGSWTMMRALVMDKALWKKHIMLDKNTGMDPPGIKLRAAQGFDATDFFITGYWIWNKILENLATIGYDPTNAFTAAYDWRMSYMNYEKRDQYFTRLKAHIEVAVKVSNRKVVLLSHSMGSQVLYYFFHWVEAKGYGNGGSSWVDEHVDSWINISGCMLGAMKGLPAVLSGEMKDTAQLNAFAVYGLEKFLSRHERAVLFRAMPGISSMLPMGGNAVWGDADGAPDDRPTQNITFGNFIRFRDSNSSLTNANLTVEDSLPYLFRNSEDWYKSIVQSSYSHGVAHTAKVVEDNQGIPAKWINPLETRLPYAPNLKIYCFYGVGKETERAYYYKEDTDPLSKTNVTIDTGYSNGITDRGVVMGEGDGTVNLLSTGYMCAKGWKMKRYNPAGVQIKTFEMPHEPDRFSPRGGPNTGDHVDILGRSSLNDLILRVAGGRGELIEENVVSNILEYAEKVKIYDEE
ncbi:Lecithin:cholesterol acyltransferase-domain-containing protein [Clohesyomyces aquaticus]|uniref:Lecithin:cholesterol acyltransferase-domain-containing protein n=1 Tax=Clohesyomyces aquaticus TaxID=1231657 RepID=A0A1Y1ZNH6_9PLEO|nr:Lecithin:cholesterol acyltransferase-domain-containing protein [Clohesyomyces aquaticus]